MPTDPVDAASSDPNIAAVTGTQTGADGTAIVGIGMGNGVFGRVKDLTASQGLVGRAMAAPGLPAQAADRSVSTP